MTALCWQDMDDRTQAALGEDWIYLVTHDARQAVLTRYPRCAPGEADQAVTAREAALNAISVDGAFEAVPEALPGLLAHMKQQAQGYESGIDIEHHPAWRHGYVPEGS